ncbi:hypothetical protein [Burkholderia pseudomallei]|uniref:hypothetical protein n=1 Tax=Burkholderia pseudomallei TaxID=28450 RepID=UPI001FD872B2|nr:hypothetical protein [Burkholderia pseudomallei]
MRRRWRVWARRRPFFAPTINILGNPIEMYYTETGSQAYVGLDGKTRHKSYATTAKARAFQYRSDIVPSLVAEDVSKLWPKLPPNVASIPLPSSTLTKLVDETWKRAATDPDYKGLPYEPVYDRWSGRSSRAYWSHSASAS